MADPTEPAAEPRLRKADFATGLILSLFGAVVFIAVMNFRWDLPSIQQDGWYTAPGIIPAGVAVVLVLQGIYLAIKALRSGGRWQQDDLLRLRAALKSPSVLRAGIVALLLCIYIFGMVGRVHFTVASFLFLSAFMFIFKAGAWWKILLISAIASAAISFVFGDLVRVPLP